VGVSTLTKSDDTLAARCAPLVADYVQTICGPEPPAGVTADALARITAGAADGLASTRAPDLVRKSAREAALTGFARSHRHARLSFAELARPRFSHRRVPELLRRRATDEISARDSRWLNATLASCHDCGRLAASMDAAEWRLTLALRATLDPAAFDRDPGRNGARAGAARQPVPIIRAPGRRRVVWLVVGALVLGAGADAAALLLIDSPHAKPRHTAPTGAEPPAWILG
jgi:hypothetical protein